MLYLVSASLYLSAERYEYMKHEKGRITFFSKMMKLDVRLANVWYPAADIYDVSDGWIVKVELAGVSPEDIHIVAQGNLLFISGVRKDKTCKKALFCRQMEIVYDRFEKTLALPENLENIRIEHRYEDGFLYLYLKKLS
jgi:HSP20 family protein